MMGIVELIMQRLSEMEVNSGEKEDAFNLIYDDIYESIESTIDYISEEPDWEFKAKEQDDS